MRSREVVSIDHASGIRSSFEKIRDRTDPHWTNDELRGLVQLHAFFEHSTKMEETCWKANR